MALPISCAAPVPMHGRVRPNELSARVAPRLTLFDQDPSGSFFELGPPVVPRFAMNPVDPQGPPRRRWKWFVIAPAAIVSVVVAAVWLIAEPASPGRTTDCVVVEETTRQWQATVASLTPAQGAIGPTDEFVDQQYLQMSAMMQAAADSVKTPEIKQHLSEWAAAADRLATSQQNAAGASPGMPDEMLEVFTHINDAAGALGELCPNMPSAQR